MVVLLAVVVIGGLVWLALVSSRPHAHGPRTHGRRRAGFA